MKNKTSIKSQKKALHKALVMRSCPFCGCKPKLSLNHSSTTALIVSSFEVDISCRSKKCKVHPSLTGYNRFAYSKEEKRGVVETVIKQWNTRA
jgi:hypothetical protein